MRALFLLSLFVAQPFACRPEASPRIRAEGEPILSHLHTIVEPGRSAEINLAFDGPNAADATFKAESSLAWNVHSHPDGGVVIHQNGKSADGVIQFRAPNAGTFSFMWKNESSGPVALDVDVAAESGVRELR